MEKKRNIFIRPFHYLWSLFLTGLFAILPITLTIAIFSLTFQLLLNWLEPLKRIALPPFLQAIPHAEIILAILIIFLVGTIYNVFIVRTIINAFEELLIKLPLIRPVYSGIKQLVQAFSFQDRISFKSVVLVEFPRKGIYSIGFLTSELQQDLAPEKGKTFFNVFIPTTPNPTSGYFAILPKEHVTMIDITRQEAMAMIISGGIIQPERFEEKKEKP